MRPRPPPPPVAALLAAIAPLALGACSSKDDGQRLHVPSPAWEEQVVYFVMTDRFANGDPTNDDQGMGEWDPSSAARYSGGDLQGIIDRLDYIQGLGATAVWITPPVANMWWDPLQQFGGYHGYWARNLKEVDEHLGTLETYKALSDALHRRGMFLIQDVVPNHMGNFFTFSAVPPPLPACGPAAWADQAASFVLNSAAIPTGAPEQAPFDQIDMTDPAQRAAAVYHWTPPIADFTDACQEVNYQISDLDDLNTENPAVRQALRDSYGYWIREVGVDAFRVDTVKFVPHEFWNDFFHSTDPAAPGVHAVAAATGRDRFFAFGEVFETSPPLQATAEARLASYLGTPPALELPSVLGFPLYEEIGRVFAGGQPTAHMTYRLERLVDPALFPNPHVIPNFLDNHDVRRFLSVTSPTGEDLLQALAFLFTVPGIPIVYYGTEQGFTETRAAMFAGGFGSTTDRFDTSSAVYQRIRKLADLRKRSPALTRGALAVLYDAAAGPGPFAYRRTRDAETVLVLLNTARNEALVAGMETGLAPGTVLEVLHSEQSPLPLSVGAGGRVTTTLPPRAVVIARPTGTFVTPPLPAAVITVATPIDGETFSGDVTLTGTVSPPETALRMVLDGNLARATTVTVTGDGSWSALLPVSEFPTGIGQHDLSFWAPVARVATPRARFTSDVVFQGDTYVFDDPIGDDTGPSGKSYTYPLDATFGSQMDIEGVTLEVGVTTMRLNLRMADFSTVWNPPLGYDHVAFNVYFSLPGPAGATVMPKLSASVPAGFSWQLAQFGYGWENVMYGSAGAGPDAYGPPTTAPTVKTDPNGRTVTFTYDRNAYGLASWSGVRIYVATWDYDGIGARFRPLCSVGSSWEMGGGLAASPPVPCDGTGFSSDDPKIMDDAGPFAIP